MYGTYANIGGVLMVNVTIYSIHGSYGICHFAPFSAVSCGVSQFGSVPPPGLRQALELVPNTVNEGAAPGEASGGMIFRWGNPLGVHQRYPLVNKHSDYMVINGDYYD